MKQKILAILLFCVCNCSGQQNREVAIDSYLLPYVQTNNFSGTVLIEKNGKVVFTKAYGFANAEKRTRNTNATQFHVASVSMQFTAAAILHLIDRGKIRLESRVSEIFPDIQEGNRITIRDLLMERSGLADINDLADYDEVLQHHQTAASLVAKIKDRPLLFEPGSKFLHEEHSAYNLIALIIEKKTGLHFAAAMRKLVFKPAGLSHTWVDDDEPGASPGVADGYQPDGVDGLRPATSIHWSGKTGNASVVTTAEDEARWVRKIFRGHFLKENSRKAILDNPERVGYGWMRKANERFHETVYYMNGRAPGFASFVMYLPQEQLSVVVFSNIYASSTTTIGNDVAATLLGLPCEPFRPDDSALNSDQIKESTGTYVFGANFYQPNAEVALFDSSGKLSLRWPGGDVSPLIALSQDRFIDRAYWEDVTLERDPNGLVKAISYGRFRGARKQ